LNQIFRSENVGFIILYFESDFKGAHTRKVVVEKSKVFAQLFSWAKVFQKKIVHAQLTCKSNKNDR